MGRWFSGPKKELHQNAEARSKFENVSTIVGRRFGCNLKLLGGGQRRTLGESHLGRRIFVFLNNSHFISVSLSLGELGWWFIRIIECNKNIKHIWRLDVCCPVLGRDGVAARDLWSSSWWLMWFRSIRTCLVCGWQSVWKKKEKQNKI